MKKIDGYDEAQAWTGESTRPTPGGYVLRIVDVEANDQKEYLKIYYDIDKGATPEADAFIGMYKRRNADKNYDFPTFFRSYKKSAVGFFKAFIQAVQASNDGFAWDWNEKALVGKFVGAAIRDEKYTNQQGEARLRSSVYSTMSADKALAGEFKVQASDTLDDKEEATPQASSYDVPF